MRRWWLLGVLWGLSACGPGPQAAPGADERGSWPGGWVGDSCDAARADVGACASGLMCRDGSCDWPGCAQATDPDSWCRATAGAGAACLMGSCEVLALRAGERCDVDEQCGGGLSCAQQRCTPRCADDAGCADGDVCKNQIQKNTQNVYPLGYDRFSGQTFGNKNFLLNCMNYLLDNSGLISVRSRELKLRLLDKKKTEENKSSIKMIFFISSISPIVNFFIFII